MTSPSSADAPAFSSRYRATVLAVLVLAYTLNFIDRTIISIIALPIKADLKLTDTQLGWLGGLSFALLYTTLGIPIARLAERRNRVNIIALAILVWSGFTALCGTATSYLSLLLFRVGVGVGEAGLSPPAHSLISDYYPPQKRAMALSIYSLGIPLGMMFGAVAGGWFAQHVSWRAAFFAVGAPGLLVALILKLTIREPPRGWSEAAAEPAAPARMRDVARRLFSRWGLANVVAGVTVVSFASYGMGQYAPAYLLRTFPLDLTQVGLMTGLVAGVANGAGLLLGGWLTQRLARRSARSYALVPALGVLLAAPLYVLAYTRETWPAAVGVLLLAGVVHYLYLGPTFAVVQNAFGTRSRATAAALLLFTLNLIALGFGPPFTGWCIDMFTQHAWSGAGSFVAACPGGTAPAGSGAAAQAACAGALAQGTRAGMIVTALLFVWGSLHYLLGALTLHKDVGAD
ncbi:spinster family MFS transporter [Phenylobacterium sp.]|jgi:MFS family permease|uniref:spinster family MFS transporter n=1 Tax=Phenylobacterium sp. TaxID=1871053 RepID=UPI00378374E9